MDDFSFSEEEGADTTDSLDIKPPQATVAHKSSSSRRRDKHSDRRDRREDKDRKSRHHHRYEPYREKHRHRRHGAESGERSDGSKRDRDRLEQHSREADSSRHERKDRSTGDRVLEDLRTRLLDKRRERDDPRDMREERIYKKESRREARIDEMRESRDRREMRIEERRESRVTAEEMAERTEKRHKRNRERAKVEAMEAVPDNEPVEINKSQPPAKDPKEMTEQELRRERLLEAEREMARRKEASRLELEARRLKRGEKRIQTPSPNQDPSIVELSDESQSGHSDDDQSKSPKSQRQSSEERNSANERSSDRDSSSSSSDDDSNDSNDSARDDSNGSDYNNASPLSVDRLAKSDHSDGDSPGRVESNGVKMDEDEDDDDDDEEEEEEEEEKEDEEPGLPPYLPAIQGCRSVEEFQCLNRIEEGTYGVVYRARDKRTDEIVALKRLKMEKEKEGFPITSLREINTLLKAQHPNIVTVREIVVGSNMDKIFIVMDYVEHDLKSLMETMKQKKQVFIPGEVKCLMQQLLRAVEHLHDNWILHRDLKTSNLLLSHQGILKVGDFGLAREYGSPLRPYTSVVVTQWYRAPELLLNTKEYSTPIDMWSVGCIFAELIRMEALFPGKSEIDQLDKIFKELGTPNERIWPGYNKLPVVQKMTFVQYPVNNLRQRFQSSLTEQGIGLLNKMLTYDPAQRISAEDALKHAYFTEAPLPIDPSMFPTWPAKSELGARTGNASPKPPSGGREYKALGDNDEAEINNSGFHMGMLGGGRAPPEGGGFHLKF